MGLPTGVEVKTAEPAKPEETAAAATTVEEVKPVVTPVETPPAATGTANADATDAVEVRRYSLCQRVVWVFFKAELSGFVINRID